MNNQLIKISITVLFVSVTGGIIIPLVTGSVYPWNNIMFTSGILLILYISYKDSSKHSISVKYITLIIILSISYRVRIFQFPASLIGMDPGGYAVTISQLAVQGDTSAIGYPFYSKASHHFIQGAIYVLITNLPSPESFIIYTVVSGLLIPVIAASFANLIRPGMPKLMTISAGGTSILSYTVHHSYWPIAQTTGALLYLLTVFSIISYIIKRNKSYLLLGVVIFTAGIYTHKLTPLLTASSIVGVLVLNLIYIRNQNKGITNRLLISLAFVSAIFTIIQFFYITQYGQTVFFKIFYNEVISGIAGEIQGRRAVDPYSLRNRIFKLSHVLLLGILSGLIWLRWLWHSQRKYDFVYLGIVFPPAIMIVAFYALGEAAPRVISYTEVLLFVLIVLGGYFGESPQSKIKKSANIVFIFVFVLLIISSGLSPIAGPDSDIKPRYYLTQEEVDAKMWGYLHIQDPILTDQFYSTSSPPQIIHGGSSNDYKQPDIFKDGTNIYVDKELLSTDYNMIAHRSCIDIYRSPIGLWKLTYNPSPILNDNRNKVYDSGCVNYYAHVSGI